MNKMPVESKTTFFTSLLLLTVLPVVVAIVILQHVTAGYFAQIASSNRTLIHKELSQIRREADDAFFIERQINSAYGMLIEEPVTSTNIGRHLQALKKQRLGFVNFRFFDNQRRLIPVAGESETLRAVIQRIFEALSQPETEGDDRLLLRYQAIFETFLGAVSPGELASHRSSLVRVLIKGRPGYFYWNLFYSPDDQAKYLGGMVAWFSLADIPENLAVKQLIGRFNQQLGKGSAAGLIDLSAVEKSFPLQLPEGFSMGGLPGLSNEITSMRREFVSEKSVSGGNLFIAQIDSDKILYFLQRQGGAMATKIPLLLKIVSIVLCPWLIYVVLTSRSSGLTLQQLCFKHAGLVILFVAGFPIVILALLGQNLVSLQRQVLQYQTRESLARYIENLDENFVVAIGNLEKTYRRFASSENLVSSHLTNVEKNFNLLKKADAVQRLYLIDKNGRILLGLPDKAVAGEMIGKLMSAVARKLFL
ncbi:MAG: hypothetical protein PHD82_02255, partial [Candidatus Riflebacteria bacterium]|nr:hypothetical protein [Candidatus Riflebacteria bacterium]